MSPTAWGWALLALSCLAGSLWLWRAIAGRLRGLGADVRLIATANPGHRVSESGPRPIRYLAAAVNQLAERYQQEQSDVAVRIAEANQDLERERTRLAVLMSELSVAVLVCSTDGRILLYNAAARQVLDAAGGIGRTPVGLGRSVFAVLDRNLVAYALERGTTEPVAAIHGDRLLRAQIVPVTEPGGRDRTGFVVTLEDTTRQAERDRARQDLLASLTQGSRASIGAIRAAVENVLDYPQMAPEQRARFLEVIRQEAVGMGERLERALAGARGEDPWLATDVQACDLLDALARGLQRAGFGVEVTACQERLWLQVDGYALQRLVVALGRRLTDEQRVERFGLRVTSSDRLGALDLLWPGTALDVATVRAWVVRAAGADGDGHDAITRHGGEVWSGVEDGQGPGGGRRQAYLRILLPRAPETPAPAAAAPAAAAAAASWGPSTSAPASGAAPDRVPSYDFSLLQGAGEAGPWQDRPLSELSFTVFDTETTGLHAREGHEIISIGAVRIVNGRLLRQETFDALVDPRRSVPPESVAIHGITPEELAGQPTLDVVLPAFAGFAEQTVLVGHHIAFDLQFIVPYRAHTGGLLRLPVLDTLLLSAVANPEQDSHTIEHLARRLGVTVIGRHTALGDALMTGELLLKLIPLLERRDVRTLGQAQEASRLTAQGRWGDALYTGA